MGYSPTIGKLGWDTLESLLERCRLPILLWGPPATGKTRAATRMGLAGRTCYRCLLSDDSTSADLIGHYEPAGDGFRWIDGPFITALRTGGRLLIDEVEKAGGDCQTRCLEVCEDPADVEILLATGEVVCAAAGFQVVCTSNEDPTDLPDALASRLGALAIHIDRPHASAFDSLPDDVRDIARGTCGASDGRGIDLRTWNSYAHVRDIIGPDTAAACAFGESSEEILADLRLAAGGDTKAEEADGCGEPDCDCGSCVHARGECDSDDCEWCDS